MGVADEDFWLQWLVALSHTQVRDIRNGLRHHGTCRHAGRLHGGRTTHGHPHSPLPRHTDTPTRHFHKSVGHCILVSQDSGLVASRVQATKNLFLPREEFQLTLPSEHIVLLLHFTKLRISAGNTLSRAIFRPQSASSFWHLLVHQYSPFFQNSYLSENLLVIKLSD
jgi:hypothetical protein